MGCGGAGVCDVNRVACPRCGVERVARPVSLCRDCRSVLTEKEREEWVK